MPSVIILTSKVSHCFGLSFGKPNDKHNLGTAQLLQQQKQNLIF